jgi:hypothetical protein
MKWEGELAAGNALDALVAERVLGWVPEVLGDPINGLTYSHLRRNPSRDGPMWLHDNPPAVSTSVEAAWQVVEALGAASVALTLRSVRSFGEAEITYRAFTTVDGRRSESTSADSPALAICGAALRAMGVEVRVHSGESPPAPLTAPTP